MSDNRLLIMDDDHDVSSFFGEVSQSMGFETLILNEPSGFFETVERFDPTVLFLDLQMPDQDGIELLRGLADTNCRAAIYIASGLDSRVLATAEQLGNAMGLPVAGVIRKPIALEALRALLSQHKDEEKLITADQLSHAIENGELVVHYLPKASAKGSGRWIIEAAEALVRWEHPEYGLLYPNDFIGIAEETGLIIGLTDYVFRAAMQQAHVWFTSGIYMELGVNVSAAFLTDLEFPDRLLTLVKEHNLDPSMVTLELTETAAMVDPDVTLDVLARLRVKNVNLCLDDFGAGYSSLTQLYRLPFTEVKLDNAFINDMRGNEHAQRLVEGLIYLAHKLNLRTCAEGVEDEAMLRLLESMDCDKIQGHLIGPAVRPRELAVTVENWNARQRKDSRVSKTA